MADPLGNLLININNSLSQFISDIAGGDKSETAKPRQMYPKRASEPSPVTYWSESIEKLETQIF